jgi:hypothetical protein
VLKYYYSKQSNQRLSNYINESNKNLRKNIFIFMTKSINHEQLSGKPTSLGDRLVERPIHCLIALIVLKSRWTLV